MKNIKMIDLDIPRLGGMQTFEVSNKPASSNYFRRYVCSTFPGDGHDNGDKVYDIMQTRDGEYVAIPG